jgi:hypothetical protein
MLLRQTQSGSPRKLPTQAKSAFWRAASMACTVLLLVGCDSPHWGTTNIDGYWKGQIVEVETNDNGETLSKRGGERPLRILMLLEETGGVVQGKFAQSSDVVAFTARKEGGSRSVSVDSVEGTRDGTRIHMQFSSNDGRHFQVKATIGAGKILGTYSAINSAETPLQRVTEDGTFEIERY